MSGRWRGLVCAAALAIAPHDSTWVDHDGQAIPRPPDWEPDFWGHQYREVVVEPLSHALDIPDKFLLVPRAFGARTRREAVNVNAFDEASNSSWFTNRNHLRAVPVAELRDGPDSTLLPSKPWTIKHRKQGGMGPGFQIEDAAGRKWLVKLDWVGFPQLSSGADMVARTLLHAAGYNVPHNEPVHFVRGDLRIDQKLEQGSGKDRFTSASLDSVLAKGAVLADGSYSATASLYLTGHVLGSPSVRRLRPGDSNDWYQHRNRRELRGLYVVSSWIGYWDTKDANFLDVFVPEPTRGRGHVEHYILDAGSSLGATADGEKPLADGYEGVFDYGWIARRLVTLGFVVEPWRRARQDTGIPSAGRFESDVFDPGKFVPEEPQAAFREMTDRDAYWGAKIVASFSDAQIGAAVDAARFEDPRAREFLVRNLIQRRDKIARYWFGRVAPLDFFEVAGHALRFHDLAVDLGLASARSYQVVVEARGQSGREGEGSNVAYLASRADGTGGSARALSRLRLDDPVLPLDAISRSSGAASVEISIRGDRAKPTRVELTKRGGRWIVSRVRHA